MRVLYLNLLLPYIPHHHLIDMFGHKGLNPRPGGGIEEVGVGHDDFFQGMGVGVGVAFQRPLGGGFAAVGGDGDGDVVELEIGDVGLDDFLVVTAGADGDEGAVNIEGHTFVGTADFFVQCRGGFGEHVAQGQQGVGLAALGTAVQTDDSHGRFGIWNGDLGFGIWCRAARDGVLRAMSMDMALLRGRYSGGMSIDVPLSD